MEDRKVPVEDPKRGPDRGVDLDARLKAAQDRIRPKAESGQKSDLGAAMRIAVDLVAGLIVGVAIGLGLDHWLGTGPWLLILFFILGAAAGIRNVMKTAQRMEAAARQPSQHGNGADES